MTATEETTAEQTGQNEQIRLNYENALVMWQRACSDGRADMDKYFEAYRKARDVYLHESDISWGRRVIFE